MERIDYKPEFIELVKDIAAYNKKILLRREGENIVVRGKSSDKHFVIHCSVNEEAFNMPVDEIGFYNFMEFYRLYSSMSKPDIFLDADKIIMQFGDDNMIYNLGNNQIFERDDRVIDFTGNQITMDLTSEIIDNICNINGIINAGVNDKNKIAVNIHGDKTNLFFKVRDEDGTRSFDKKMPFNNNTDFDFSYNFDIYADAFMLLPKKKNWVMNIKFAEPTVAFCNFKLKHDYVKFDIFCPYIQR